MTLTLLVAANLAARSAAHRARVTATPPWESSFGACQVNGDSGIVIHYVGPGEANLWSISWFDEADRARLIPWAWGVSDRRRCFGVPEGKSPAHVSAARNWQASQRSWFSGSLTTAGQFRGHAAAKSRRTNDIL